MQGEVTQTTTVSQNYTTESQKCTRVWQKNATGSRNNTTELQKRTGEWHNNNITTQQSDARLTQKRNNVTQQDNRVTQMYRRVTKTTTVSHNYTTEWHKNSTESHNNTAECQKSTEGGMKAQQGKTTAQQSDRKAHEGDTKRDSHTTIQQSYKMYRGWQKTTTGPHNYPTEYKNVRRVTQIATVSYNYTTEGQKCLRRWRKTAAVSQNLISVDSQIILPNVIRTVTKSTHKSILFRITLQYPNVSHKYWNALKNISCIDLLWQHNKQKCRIHAKKEYINIQNNSQKPLENTCNA